METFRGMLDIVVAHTFDLVHSEEGRQVGVDGMVGEHPVLLLSLRHGPTQVVVHLYRVVLAFLQTRGLKFRTLKSGCQVSCAHFFSKAFDCFSALAGKFKPRPTHTEKFCSFSVRVVVRLICYENA